MSEVIHSGAGKAPEISRRNINKAMVAALGVVSIGGVAGAVGLATRGNSESSSQEYVPVDHTISAAEADANIDQLVMPNLYEDRPWADPEQLIGLSVEELKAAAAVPMPRDNKGKVIFQSDQEVTVAIGHQLELIANYARTLWNVNDARSLEDPIDPTDPTGPTEPRYPVGELDELGNELGNYAEYIGAGVDIMLDGLVANGPKDKNFQEVKDILKEVILIYGGDYELALTEKVWRDKATLFVETTLNGNLSSTATSRMLSMGVEIRRPAVFDFQEDDVRPGDMTVEISEGTGEYYDLGLQRITL